RSAPASPRGPSRCSSKSSSAYGPPNPRSIRHRRSVTPLGFGRSSWRSSHTPSGPRTASCASRRSSVFAPTRTRPSALGAAVSVEPIKVAGVAISNPDKVWWPDEGITKSDIARFYDGIWSHVSPWMRDRPLTAERCPDGMLGGCFYRKDFPEHWQPAGPRLVLRAASTGKDVRYIVGGSRATLIGMVNLGCIAIHGMTCSAKTIHPVDWLAFDMDPPESFADAAQAGLALRKVLDEATLVSYPQPSGSQGLHVF